MTYKCPWSRISPTKAQAIPSRTKSNSSEFLSKYYFTFGHKFSLQLLKIFTELLLPRSLLGPDLGIGLLLRQPPTPGAGGQGPDPQGVLSHSGSYFLKVTAQRISIVIVKWDRHSQLLSEMSTL